MYASSVFPMSGLWLTRNDRSFVSYKKDQCFPYKDLALMLSFKGTKLSMLEIWQNQSQCCFQPKVKS